MNIIHFRSDETTKDFEGSFVFPTDMPSPGDNLNTLPPQAKAKKVVERIKEEIRETGDAPDKMPFLINCVRLTKTLLTNSWKSGNAYKNLTPNYPEEARAGGDP